MGLFLLVLLITAVVGAKNVPVGLGRVCVFGDFNNDRLTDIVAQNGENLTIYLQDDKLLNLDEVVFNNISSIQVGNDPVDCSLGDFNGDSLVDILISQKDGDKYHNSIWFAEISGLSFTEHVLQSTKDQPMVVDVNGDGYHDILGFFGNGSMYCQFFDRLKKSDSCTNNFNGFLQFESYPGFPHLYVDIIGEDLLSEFVFMTEVDDKLEMQVWGRYKHGWKKTPSQIPSIGDYKHLGAAIPADFDADGVIELLVPICQEASCEHINNVALWQYNRGWSHSQIDLGDFPAFVEEGSKIIFRTGDYTSDGYPDLLLTVVDKKARFPKIIENVKCDSCQKNGTRKFELRKVNFVQSRELALSKITLSAFFDLKEDGNLDILVEYIYYKTNEYKFSFIMCDDPGDTTFVKATVFTSVCDKRCNPNSAELGSGISWGGACMSFSMNDGWGGSLESASCQTPMMTHRALSSPYLLFGLGRSPNFVDELVIGSPRYADNYVGAFRQHTLKQIVPNSRLIIMPPKDSSGHWQTRLYVAPSKLIVQSLCVIASVCLILLLVVAVLHYKEKKEDRVERQQQSQRFHFDAM